MGVNYNVPLIPQTSKMSCWAAGIAMILAWRDRVSIDPVTIAANKGGAPYLEQFKTGLAPDDTYILRRWGLVTEAPQSYSVTGFADLLQRHGPLWIAAAVPTAHIRVVTGVLTGATAEATRVFINDPWEQGMKAFRWPNRGSHYQLSYKSLTQELEALGSLENRNKTLLAPIYVAHLP